MNIVTYPVRAMRFLYHYIVQDPWFVVLSFFAYIQSDYNPGVRFYTEAETIKHITSGKSLIRFGDGEISLMRRYSIYYQRGDKSLAQWLHRIVREYTEQSPFIFAIPERYVNRSNIDLQAVDLLRCYLPFKVTINQYFNKIARYADMHLFYVKGFFEHQVAPYLKDKILIIVTTSKNIAKLQPTLEQHFTVLKWIEAQAPNPFDRYESTLQQIQTLYQSNKDKNIVVLVSAGPMSKPLIFSLAQQNIQGLDIGHGIEYLYTEKSLDHMLV